MTRPPARSGLVRAALDTVLLYTLFGWIYAAVFAVFKPEELSIHVATWLAIRRDTFVAVCFAISAVTMFARLAIGPAVIGRRPKR